MLRVRFIDKPPHISQPLPQPQLSSSSGNKNPRPAGTAIASKLRLDAIYLKIDRRFDGLLSQFSNEEYLGVKIASLINAIPPNRKSRDELVKQIGNQLQIDYVKKLNKLSDHFNSNAERLKQAEDKARAHFAKQMERFTNIRIKQDALINAMLDNTSVQHRHQTELKELQIDRRQQAKEKVLVETAEQLRIDFAKQEHEKCEQKRREEQQKIREIQAANDQLKWQMKGEVKTIKELIPIRCTEIAAEAIKEAQVVRVSKGPLQASVWRPNANGLWTKDERIIETLATLVKDRVQSELRNEHTEIYNIIKLSNVDNKKDFIKQIDNAIEAGDQAKRAIVKELKTIHNPNFVHQLNRRQNVFATNNAIYSYNSAKGMWEKLETSDAIQTFQSKTLNLDTGNITTAQPNDDPAARLIGNSLLRGLGLKYFALQVTGNATDVKSFHTQLAAIAGDWGVTQLGDTEIIAPLRAREVRVILTDAGSDKCKKLAKRLMAVEPSPMLILLSADGDKRPPRLPKDYRLFKAKVPTEKDLSHWLISGTMQASPVDEQPAGTVPAIENELQALTEIIQSFTTMKKWGPKPTQPTQEMIGVPLAAFMDELKQFCDEQDGIPHGLSGAKLIRLLKRLDYNIHSPSNQHSIQVYAND